MGCSKGVAATRRCHPNLPEIPVLWSGLLSAILSDCAVSPMHANVPSGPDVLYVDGEWSYNSTHWGTRRFLQWLFNESPVRSTVAINDRWGNECRGKHGGFFVCEYGGEVAGSCMLNAGLI